MQDNNGINWNVLLAKFLKKLIPIAAIFMVVLLMTVTIFSPILWLAGLLGNKEINESGNDIRDTINKWQSKNHISFISSEIIACTMSSDMDYSIDKCLEQVHEDGTIDQKYVDESMKNLYEIWNVDQIKEKQGKIPDAAYDDIWIPTLYVIDYYKRVESINIDVPQTHPDYGKVTVEWVYDHTGEEEYKDECYDDEPYSKCRVIREGYWTYPYKPPAYSTPNEKYGYGFQDTNDGSIEFINYNEYNASSVLSISNGIVIETGSDESGNWIEVEYTNNGYTFYARYSGLNVIAASVGEEVEQEQELGYADIFKIYIYEKTEDIKYMNPYILYDMDLFPDGNYDDIQEGTIAGINGFEFMLPFDDYAITQEYGGTNIDGNIHNGIDLQPRPFSSAAGHTIVSGFSGVVVTNEYNSTSGNVIGIKDDKTGVIVRYCHMIERSALSVGDHVERGQVIGFVGMTGLATGYHVHLTFIAGGGIVDPRSLVNF